MIHTTVRKTISLQRAILSLLLAVLCAALLSTAALAHSITAGRVLVRLKPGANINQLATDYGLRVGRSVSARKIYHLVVPVGSEMATARLLSSDARVRYAEADVAVGLPEVQANPYAFGFDGYGTLDEYVNQSALEQIQLPTTSSVTGAGVTVAVLDTGSTPSHPALVGHLLPGYNILVPGNAPLDVADGTTNAAVGHGTMISGIIAEVAPEAMIMPIRVINADGVGTMLDVVNAITYAVANGAQVISMSFSSTQGSTALQEAVQEARDAGVVLVGSTGNDNTNILHYPAAYAGMIAVSAVDANNVKSSYANYGSYVGVVAPGDGILSTFWDGGYASWSGTSFSTPFVSAEAALVISAFPTYSSHQVKSKIENTATSINSLNAPYVAQLGSGLINISAALQAP